MADSTPTMYAPAERAGPEVIARDARKLTKELVNHITNIIQYIVLVLNKNRQIVYHNRYLMEFMGLSSVMDILGKRPGELLDCIHAYESPGGCGTTEFCRQCGAVNAILQSQARNTAIENECRIMTTKGFAYDFKVWASPYNPEHSDFTVFSIIDISNDKRRRILERTFFHDINNILMMMSGYIDLLTSTENQTESAEYINTINMMNRELAQEIISHKKILQAENGELSVNISRITSLSLLEEIANVYARKNRHSNRLILDIKNFEDMEFVSDRTLLFRVLGNMVKNALESSSEEETVTIACNQNKDSIIFRVHNAGYISRPVQLQIFQRSFSTKGDGRGVGTYSMKLFGEKYLKGKVWFTTSEKEGTDFFISLPVRFPEE